MTKKEFIIPKFRVGDVISQNEVSDDPNIRNLDYTIVGFSDTLPDYLVDGGNIPSCSIGIDYIDKNYHIKEQKPNINI